jgi:maleate isomerase
VSDTRPTEPAAERPTGATDPSARRPRDVRFGMVVPFDMALDREYWQFLPDGASVHVTRLPIIDLPYGVEHASLVGADPGMHDAIQTLVRIEPAAIGFGCTSGSFVGGMAFEADIRRRMEASGARVAVTPMNGLLDALRGLGARRVGLGSPSGRPVAQTLADYLEEAGFQPVSLENLEIDDEEEVIAASDSLVFELARRAMRPNADAVFLSCTNLPTFAVLGDVERAVGVPVLSANQTLMWGLCQAGGIALGGAPTSLSRLGPAVGAGRA